MTSADKILERAKLLGPNAQNAIKRAIDFDEGLTDKKRAFVDEYTVDFNAARAARAVGTSSPTASNWVSKNREVGALIQKKMEQRAEANDLKAEYVRQYILDVLEFCPTDYVMLSDDGDMVVDEEAFNNAPPHFKRLVESVEVKWVHGKRLLKVNFVSKTAALAIAARFTLTQKVEVTAPAIPWDELAKTAVGSRKKVDAIEQRIASYVHNGSNGVSGPSEVGR